jgi:hypothetical protein
MKLKSTLLVSAAMLMVTSSFGQLHVTTNGQKYTLVEEGTGAWCGWCPDGAQVIEETIEPHGTSTNYPRALIASFHNSHHAPYAPDDAMELPGDPFNSSTGYITAFPMGTVDRTAVSGSVGLDRNQWASAVGTQNALTPKFDVSMKSTYDTTTRLLTVAITGKALSALTGTWSMNVYLVEDSVSSATGLYQQHSYLSPAGTMSTSGSASWFVGFGSPITPASNYAHMNVVDSILTSGIGTSGAIWGDTSFYNPAAGATRTRTYTCTIPKDTSTNPRPHKWNYMKVIGLVQKYGSTASDRAIENSIEAKLRLMPKNAVGVTTVSKAMMDLQVFPNPAKNYIKVKGTLEYPSETKIFVYNSLGRVVFEQEYKAGGSLFGAIIPLDNISNGTYFMNIINNNEITSKEFTIQR